MARAKTRFNLLLLDEGEYLLEEYSAVAAFWQELPTDGSDAGSPEWRGRGRLRVCTRSLCFEPEDVRVPVLKYAYRHMGGKPTTLHGWGTATPVAMGSLGAAAHAGAQTGVPAVTHAHTHMNGFVGGEGISARDAIVCQVTSVTEVKPGNVIGPYKQRTLCEASAATSSGSGYAQADSTSSTLSAKARAFLGSGKPAAAAAGAQVASGAERVEAGQHRLDRPTLVIGLQHATASSVLPVVLQCWDVQQAAMSAPASFERAALAAVLAGRKEGSFNLSLLSDYRERPLLPVSPAAIPVERVFPLVTCPGRILVTEKAVYIQPVALNNVAGGDPVMRWWLRDIKRVLRRTRLLQHVGLELVLKDRSSTSTAADAVAAGLRADSPAASSVFLAFQTRADRDTVYRVVLDLLRGVKPAEAGSSRSARPPSTRRKGSASTPSSSLPIWRASISVPEEYDDTYGDPTFDGLYAATHAWQQKALSNFEYLSLVNSIAGRSVSDLTQYPVFPWVIADYTSRTLDLNDPASFRDLSKPMGALNASRLENVRERYREMPRGDGMDPPFLWGTHYSTPGYCLYYLVRSMPEHMLKLQSGRFDAADRLFFDLAATWAGVTSTNMDVKELTPEFYNSDGAFLLIPDGLDLGVRQSGKRVANVALPPWAYDAGDFVARCREALESEYVSARLHEWIDLIFGFKQRGPAAEAADNVFYYMTYEGAVDIDALAEPERRHAIQQQLAEFGQCPRQIFEQAHVSRTGPTILRAPALLPGVAASGSETSEVGVHDVGDGDAARELDALREDGGSIVRQDGSESRYTSFSADPRTSVQSGMHWESAVLSKLWLPSRPPADEQRDASGGGTPAPMEGYLPRAHKGSISSCAIISQASTESGRPKCTLITGGRDGETCVGPLVLGIGATATAGATRIHTPSRTRADTTFADPALVLYNALYPETPLPVSAVACVPEADLLLIASWDHCIHAFALTDGSPTAAWPAHDGVPTGLHVMRSAHSDAGVHRLLVASSGMDCVVRMWCAEVHIGVDSKTFKCFSQPALELRLDGCTPTAVQFAPDMGHDGVLFAVGDASGGVQVLQGLEQWQRRPGSGQLPWSQRSGYTQSAAAAEPAVPDHVCSLGVAATCTFTALQEACARAYGDLLNFGVSGTTAIRWFEPTPDAPWRELAATTAAGHVAVLRATREVSSKTMVSLTCRQIVCTGEVLRCLELLGSLAITGGNAGVVRIWDCGDPTAERSEATEEEDADGGLLVALPPAQPGQVHEEKAEAARSSPPAHRSTSISSIATALLAARTLQKRRHTLSWHVKNAVDIGKQAPEDQWITAVAVVPVSRDTPDTGKMPDVCITSCDRRGRIAAWLSVDGASAGGRAREP